MAARAVMLILAMALIGCIDICRSPTTLTSETAAIREIQRIHEAEKAFRLKCRRYGTLETLHAEGLLAPASSAGGYHYRLVQAGERFHLEAWPVEYNRTGRRSFYSDEWFQTLESWTPVFVRSSSKPLE